MALLDDLLDLAARPAAALPDEACRMARASLVDWLVCGRAGAHEPVARKLVAFAAREGTEGPASLFGGGRASVRNAALVNGGASHALDYDDTHFAHVGHLSVGIYPAALAVGEEKGARAAEVAEAFLVGAEAAIRVGLVLGRAHYNSGFHQTATAGAFGATVAAGRLYGLDREAMRAALGLCATRASGLRSQFGTMGKPYNAGIAASNGVECATLAALGLSSADDGLMGPLGFVPTHSDAPEAAGADGFLFLSNSYKFHACCHGTHAMIEALRGLRATRSLDPEEVSCVRLRTGPRWLSVCDIKTPRTGLEVKFSYALLAAMVFHDLATDDERTYADTLAADPTLAAFARRVEVVADDGLSDQQAAGEVELVSGETLPFAHDLAAEMLPEVLDARLAAKARAVLGELEADDLHALMAGFPARSARDIGAFVAAPASVPA